VALKNSPNWHEFQRFIPDVLPEILFNKNINCGEASFLLERLMKGLVFVTMSRIISRGFGDFNKAISSFDKQERPLHTE